MLRKCRRRRWPRLHRRVSPGPRGTAPERILQRSGTPAARARVRAQLRQQGADEPPSPASNAAQQPSCQLASNSTNWRMLGPLVPALASVLTPRKKLKGGKGGWAEP